MKKDKKTFYRLCKVYNELTNIEIEFLYDDSTEKLLSEDYAKSHILKCECRDKKHCTHSRDKCPVWQNIKW